MSTPGDGSFRNWLDTGAMRCRFTRVSNGDRSCVLSLVVRTKEKHESGVEPSQMVAADSAAYPAATRKVALSTRLGAASGRQDEGSE